MGHIPRGESRAHNNECGSKQPNRKTAPCCLFLPRDLKLARIIRQSASTGACRIYESMFRKKQYGVTFHEYIHYDHVQLKRLSGLILAPVLALAPAELGLDNEGTTVNGVNNSVAGVEGEVAPGTRVPDSRATAGRPSWTNWLWSTERVVDL